MFRWAAVRLWSPSHWRQAVRISWRLVSATEDCRLPELRVRTGNPARFPAGLRAESSLTRQHDGALDGVFQLTDIAGPGVIQQAAFGFGRDSFDGAAAAGRGAVEEILGQRRDVAGSLAQRRHAERHHIQAVVEIRAEGAALRLCREVAIGGGDQADIELPGARAADAFELALLQDAQELGLQLRRQFADLVEKDGAAFGHLELALLLRHGAGEGALLVSEQLAFQQRLGERGAVDGDEGFGGARAEAVQGAGHQFLARAGLAQDEHRSILWSHAGNQPEHLVDRDALAGNAGFGGAEPFAQEGVFGAQPLHVAQRFRARPRRAWQSRPGYRDARRGWRSLRRGTRRPAIRRARRAVERGMATRPGGRIDHGAFAGNGGGQGFHFRGVGVLARRGSQLFFVAPHQDRARRTRHDIGEQGVQAGFEVGALAGSFGGGKRAEQKEDGAGTQQRVARGGIGSRRGASSR